MATQTFPFATFGEQVHVEIDVNNATWRPSKVRCINQSTKAAVATILDSGAQVFEVTALAGQTTTWNISGVQLGWDSVDGGLMLGTYVIQARWPAV